MSILPRKKFGKTESRLDVISSPAERTIKSGTFYSFHTDSLNDVGYEAEERNFVFTQEEVL
jgi:hypothetical protein